MRELVHSARVYAHRRVAPDAVIIDALRTPIGRHAGMLAGASGPTISPRA